MNKFIIEDLYNNKLYYFMGVESPQNNKRATITSYSTSSGTKISDNSYLEPETLSFSLILSSVAMSGQKVLDNETHETRQLSFEEVQNIIDSWIDNAIRLNITTFTAYHKNMVLNNISTPENALAIWRPTLNFQEVRKADAEFISLEFPKNSQEAAAGASEQEVGTNNGVSAGDVGRVLGTTGSGALVGAAIGSVIPGIGTAAGAVIGGVYGFFQGLFNW